MGFWNTLSITRSAVGAPPATEFIADCQLPIANYRGDGSLNQQLAIGIRQSTMPYQHAL